jgi:hypothetical protein
VSLRSWCLGLGAGADVLGWTRRLNKKLYDATHFKERGMEHIESELVFRACRFRHPSSPCFSRKSVL